MLPTDITNAASNGETSVASRRLKTLYVKSKSRLEALSRDEGFHSQELTGHKDRVMVVHYRGGKLATGSDDLSIRLVIRTGLSFVTFIVV